MLIRFANFVLETKIIVAAVGDMLIRSANDFRSGNETSLWQRQGHAFCLANDSVLETKIIVAAARSYSRWKRNIIVAVSRSCYSFSKQDDPFWKRKLLWQRQGHPRKRNIIVTVSRSCYSFSKQDDQRRLAAILPAAIGGHTASGDLAHMPSAAIGAHAVSMNRQSLPQYHRFDKLF